MATTHIDDHRRDSFPPSVRSIGELEDLWPIDPIVEATWEARRGRRHAVQAAGITAIVAFLAGTVGLARSSEARGAMVAWGTMGGVTRSAVVHAAAAAPKPAAPIPAAPAAHEEAAPAAPAPAPVAEPAAPSAAVPAKHAAPPASIARKAARRSYLEDPYADAEKAPRTAPKPYLSDPY